MERGFGVLEGKVYRGPRNKPEDTEERLAGFWTSVKELHNPSYTVVIVSHGGALSSMMNHAISAGLACAPGVSPSRFWNCSLSEIQLSPNGTGSINSWADVRHLEKGVSRLGNADEAIS